MKVNGYSYRGDNLANSLISVKHQENPNITPARQSLDFLPVVFTVITLNIGTPRPATVVVLNIKQFNFTLK